MIDCRRGESILHRIHSSLNDQTAAAYASVCILPASATAQHPEHNDKTNPNSLIQSGANHRGVITIFLIA